MAAWVESTDGALVQTISLWHLAGEIDRWLSDLRAWYTASGGTATNSSATRAGGSYTVAWDLKDTNGAKVAAGDYLLCIEGAREHGNYELIQQPITVGSAAAEEDEVEAADLGEDHGVHLPAVLVRRRHPGLHHGAEHAVVQSHPRLERHVTTVDPPVRVT